MSKFHPIAQKIIGNHVTILAMLCLTYLSLAKTEVPVFLLSGQSNMTGYGSRNNLSTDQKKTVPNVKIYMDLVWEGDTTKLRRWLTLGPGFGSKADSLGPELFLGRTLSDSFPNKKFAIIKCSSGSSYLGKASDWLPPSSNNGTGGTLYKRMVASISTALNSFNTAFDTSLYTPRWAGFVWLQGEFDAGDINLSNAYKTNLTNLIKDIRNQLKVSDLPVIIPMIDALPKWANYTIIRAADVAMTTLYQNVDTLDTKGYPTDGTHFTGLGQVKIGTVTAWRWMKMKYNYGTTGSINHKSVPSQIMQQTVMEPSSSTMLFDVSGRQIGNIYGSNKIKPCGVFISVNKKSGLGSKGIMINSNK